MISVAQLNRRYGDLHAVKDVSFSIKSGEIIGLLGPNGAGKTTIMKMLCGYLEPSSGQASVNGFDVALETKQAQAQIGYLPENLPVYPEMSVIGYLEYAAGLRGIAESDLGEEIRRVIAATDLKSRAFDRIADLSRGLKQRVGVAQALLGRPKVLILDEPTNGLDPNQTLQMRALIRRLAQSATVILSTHILSEVEAMCDRVLMVRSGELVLDARLDELQQSSAIAVRSSLDVQQLRACLQGLDGVSEINLDQTRNTNGVQVVIDSSDRADAICAEIARTVIAQGGALYHLGQRTRDLESLFREINESNSNREGLSHAA